jgi:hypothetical protein
MSRKLSLTAKCWIDQTTKSWHWKTKKWISVITIAIEHFSITISLFCFPSWKLEHFIQ